MNKTAINSLENNKINIVEFSPEPGPNFTIGRQEWGVAWPLFFNIHGTIFALLFLYSLKNITALLATKIRFQRKKLFIAVNSMLAYLTFVTSMSLLLDPYDSGEHFEVIKFRGIIFLLLGMRLPCLTASFSLITMSLLEVTKLQVYSKRVQNYKFIYGIIAVHTTLVLVADLVFFFYRHVTTYLLTCQLFMVIIGLSISVASCYAGHKVISYYKRNLRNLAGSTSTPVISKQNNNLSTKIMNEGRTYSSQVKFNNNRVSAVVSIKKMKSQTFRDTTVRKVAQMTIITAFFGVGYGIVIIYSLISVFQSSSEPSVWQWYVFQNCLNIAELGMTASMLYTVRRGSFVQTMKRLWRK